MFVVFVVVVFVVVDVVVDDDVCDIDVASVRSDNADGCISLAWIQRLHRQCKREGRTRQPTIFGRPTIVDKQSFHQR